MEPPIYDVEADGVSWTEAAWNPEEAALKASLRTGQDSVIKVKTRVYGWRSYHVLGSRYVLRVGDEA